MHLDVFTLETWLWDAACGIRGAAALRSAKDFILPDICPYVLLFCSASD
jgi:type I restriction enzyme M protein